MNPFVLSGIAVAIILLIGVPVVSAVRSGVGWRPWACYQLSALLSILFWRWKATNACTYPEHGPAIIVANHTSPTDPVQLWLRHFTRFSKYRMRVIGFMMAREYYERPGFVGWICRAMQSIPVERTGRDMGPVREALKRLQQGDMLGLFPEGRLNLATPDTQLLKSGSGVAWLALKSRAPVIPVFIRNAPRSKSMIRCFVTRSRTQVTYGQPLDLSAWLDKKPSHAVLAEVTDVVMRSIAELGGIDFTPSEPDAA